MSLLQDPFLVYRNYVCVRNHFTKVDYDYFRYNGKCRAKRETFEKRKDCGLFHRIARTYTESETLGFFVSQAIDNELNPNTIGNNFLKAQVVYRKWKKRVSMTEVNFRYDLDIMADRSGSSWRKLVSCKSGFPLLFGLLTSGVISPETYSLLEKAGGIITACDNALNDNLFTAMNLRYRKYAAFLEPTVQEIISVIKKSKLR